MRSVKNEEGVALITAVLFTLMSLVMVMTLLYLVIQSTKLSAAHRQYKNSLEAAHGGVELFTQSIMPDLYKALAFNNMSSTRIQVENKFATIGLKFAVTTPVLSEKVDYVTSQWLPTTSRTADPKTAPDMTFRLQGANGQPGFIVYTKIVDNITGSDKNNPDREQCNTNKSGLELEPGIGVVNYGGATGGGVSLLPTPCLYRLEIQGERETNPREKAILSVLYAY